MNIFDILRERGTFTVPADFYSLIAEWKSWYQGDVKKFHHYTVYNGYKHVKCKMYRLGMAKKVSQDWANLLMNEKVKITLEGQREQDFFDQVCRDNSFAVKINEMQELKSALGTTAYVASVRGMKLAKGRTEGGSVTLDYVTAENIFPSVWANGKVQDCTFSSQKHVGDKNYVYLQEHKLTGGEYVISNLLFEDTNGDLKPVAINSVEGFENIPAEIHTGSDKRQFVIDKPDIVNNVDPSLPMGIAVFGNDIDSLMSSDKVYDSYVWEFVLGKKRVMIRPEATRDIDDNPTFDPNDIIFYILPEDTTNDGSLVHEIDMSLRVEQHHMGMQDMLNIVSKSCGLGTNYYKFDQGSITTATQVVSENSDLFRNIKKHEIILEDVLIELARIILRLGNTALGMGLDENIEISVDFDDSIIEDTQAEENKVYRMLEAGLMGPVEARSILMNEDEKTARAALPNMEDMTDEEENEIE